MFSSARAVAAVVVVAVAATAASCDEDRPLPIQTATPPAQTVVAIPTAASGLPVIELRAGDARLFVEVAQDPDVRSVGLGGRASMPEDWGMLFDSGNSRLPSFSMRGMQFPLDFIWLDDAKRIISIDANARPEPGVPNEELRRYSPGVPVRYVLEVNAGVAARLGVQPGDELVFEVPPLSQ